VNTAEVVRCMTVWISAQVAEAGKKGVVLGLSGGVDSAVVGAVARRALGDSMLALYMPCHSQPEDEKCARLVADHFQIPFRRVDLTPVYEVFRSVLPSGSLMAAANLKPRLRMSALYFVASSNEYLVCGASNRSEIAVGYFTKYGDNGADILPLGAFLKRQVRELAEELAVPNAVIERPPTAGLWMGQTDEKDMGITYSELDQIIEGSIKEAGSPLAWPVFEKYEKMHRASAHKRNPVPIFVP
jgi:NAD+ synthase